MIYHKLGTKYIDTIGTTSAGGVATAASSITGLIFRNGTTASGTVTFTSKAVGLYTAICSHITVAYGWAATDKISIDCVVTVAGKTARVPIFSAELTTRDVDDVAIAGDNMNLAANAITASKIASDSFTASKFAANFLNVSKIATDAISGSKIAASGVTKIQAGLASQATASAINAKTTNLPALPAATGAQMALTAATVSGVRSGLATQSKSTAIYGIASQIKAKTDLIPAQPAAIGSAMTLTAAYDAAKTAAQAGDAMALTAGERTSLASVIVATDTIVRIESAVARSFMRSGNVYTFKNALGSNVFTMTIASGGGTVS